MKQGDRSVPGRRGIVLLLLGTALLGCDPEPEALSPAKLERHAEFGGVWLRSEVAEAFVAGDPIPRVVAFRRIGEESDFFVGSQTWNTGVRTWYLAPRQHKQSSLPSRQPASVIRTSKRSATILAEPADEVGLRTGMEVTLAEDKPVLTIRHFMENTSGPEKDLAVWSIVSLPRQGRVVMPFSEKTAAAGPPKPFRTVVFFPKANAFDPAFRFGSYALGVELDQPRSKSTKIGVRNQAGWVAWTDGQRVLTSRVEFDPQGTYPEGGANITCYVSAGKNATAWAEIEHDGPLQTVPPGQRAWLEQTLTISDIPPAVDLNDPDGLMEAIVESFDKTPE